MAEINSIDKTRQGSNQQRPCQPQFLGSLYGHGPGFAGAVWNPDALSPTLTTMQGGGREPHIMEKQMDKCEVIGILDKEGYDKENRVYNGGGLCPTLLVGNGRVKALVEDKVKRDSEKIIKVGQISSEGSEYGTVISENGISSNLVAGTHGYANNCILINQATKEGSIKCPVGGCYDASYPDSKTRRGRVQEGGDVTPTITAQGGENINYVETVYRIRKLTPKECWRLMGYNDVDFDKASKVNSNTQLYKQAGNAIVKQVLMAIFSQLNIKGVKAWNDMTETEKRDIIKKTTMAGE